MMIMCKSLARFSAAESFMSNLRTSYRQIGSRKLQYPVSRQSISLRCLSNETSGISGATLKPTPFQQKILVWGKMYPSVDKVPDRVSRGQVKKAMDIFRVRSSICMAAMVFVFAAVMAMIGRKQRQDGMSITKIALEKRQ
ncbi:hypothetical protein EGW08_003120 [Elysia chlorotica]|uniref:Uncharacterized protein n=1 Tax=Elysia chlorotica TaxID=188477 RepID=A0A3S1BQN3_ELYCH|nr:hypothetical protein EGW08_003120 [Elysia chlorotica]